MTLLQRRSLYCRALCLTLIMAMRFLRIHSACDRNNCLPPDCFCESLSGPPEIPVSETPQMILLSFDDAVLPEFESLYDELFDSGRRRNPNGCPITATFYVTHDGTDYRLVQRLYAAGNEMASHSVSHRLPQSNWTRAPYQQWLDEIGGQRDNLVKLGGVRFEDVLGMRSPFLETGGDAQYRMMSEAGFEYDSSFMVGPHGNSGGAWPFTLDFPPTVPTYCSNLNCPRRPHVGVWQLPLNRWLGRSGRPCAMVDSCDSAAQPEDGHVGDALAYFWHNFGRFYRGNRAPFGIHLHAHWLLTSSEHLEAFQRFVETLLADFNDVYFVTSHQAIEWMKQPCTIDEATSFPPWRRSCNVGNITSTMTSAAAQAKNQIHLEERYVDHAGRAQPQLNTEAKHDEQAPRQRFTVTYSKDRTGVPSPHYPEVYNIQPPRLTTATSKTADITSVTASSSSSTLSTMKQITSATVSPARPTAPVRWQKADRKTASAGQKKKSTRRGAASSFKRMHSNKHNTASTVGKHVSMIAALSVRLAYSLTIS